MPNLLISRAAGPTKDPRRKLRLDVIQPVKEQPTPHADPRASTHLPSDADDVVELVGSIEVNGDAGLDGHADLLVPLVEPVQDDQIRIGTGEKGQVQLAGPERIATRPGQRERRRTARLLLALVA